MLSRPVVSDFHKPIWILAHLTGPMRFPEYWRAAIFQRQLPDQGSNLCFCIGQEGFFTTDHLGSPSANRATKSRIFSFKGQGFSFEGWGGQGGGGVSGVGTT